MGEVQIIMHRLILLDLLASYTNTTQMIMGSVFRGMGRLRLPSIMYLVTYWGVMLPLSCIFIWTLKMGVEGLFWCFSLGTALATIIFTAALLRVNWVVVAAAATECVQESAQGSEKVSRVSLQPR